MSVSETHTVSRSPRWTQSDSSQITPEEELVSVPLHFTHFHMRRDSQNEYMVILLDQQAQDVKYAGTVVHVLVSEPFLNAELFTVT